MGEADDGSRQVGGVARLYTVGGGERKATSYSSWAQAFFVRLLVRVKNDAEQKNY
jgi:hypothetical protein